jgi:hypothetical protein
MSDGPKTIIAGIVADSPAVTVARKIYSELDDFSQSIISYDFVLHCVLQGSKLEARQ